MTNRTSAMKVIGALGLFLAFAPSSGCEPQPTTSSETHFLRFCPSTRSCDGPLECTCSVCASACEEDADCSALSGRAVCVRSEDRAPEQSCGETSIETTCEVPCAIDSDCSSLGSDYRCDRNYCRALAPDCVTDETIGSDVVLMGDNFVTPAFTMELQRLARTFGPLGEDEIYRDHSSTLVGPFGGSYDLFSQYDAALTEGTFSVAILDIGGPDTLQACPAPPAADCPALENAALGAQTLLASMTDTGVEQVLVFFYPDPEDATLKAKFDLLRPMIEAACEGSAVPCAFLDLRATFAGHEADYLTPDGVLPTEAGSLATAAAVYSLMQERCVGQ